MSKAKRLFLLSACVTSTMMLATYSPAVANEAVKDVSKEVSDLRSTTQYVELYLIGDDFSPNRDMHLADVIRTGCHYKAEKQADVASLLDVVANAMVTQAPADKEGLDIRVVLHVYQDANHYLSLVMGQDYTDAPSRGRYFGPNVGALWEVPPSAMYVEAKRGLQKDLRFWGVQHASLAVKPCHL